MLLPAARFDARGRERRRHRPTSTGGATGRPSVTRRPRPACRACWRPRRRRRPARALPFLLAIGGLTLIARRLRAPRRRDDGSAAVLGGGRRLRRHLAGRVGDGAGARAAARAARRRARRRGTRCRAVRPSRWPSPGSPSRCRRRSRAGRRWRARPCSSPRSSLRARRPAPIPPPWRRRDRPRSFARPAGDRRRLPRTRHRRAGRVARHPGGPRDALGVRDPGRRRGDARRAAAGSTRGARSPRSRRSPSRWQLGTRRRAPRHADGAREREPLTALDVACVFALGRRRPAARLGGACTRPPSSTTRSRTTCTCRRPGSPTAGWRSSPRSSAIRRRPTPRRTSSSGSRS